MVSNLPFSRPVLCSSQIDSLGTSCQFNSPYIHNVCLYVYNSINKLSVSIWSMHMERDLHRLANLHGSQVQVAAGTGAGWKFPTHQKPLPAGWVAWVDTGFFFRVQCTLPLVPPVPSLHSLSFATTDLLCPAPGALYQRPSPRLLGHPPSAATVAKTDHPRPPTSNNSDPDALIFTITIGTMTTTAQSSGAGPGN